MSTDPYLTEAAAEAVTANLRRLGLLTSKDLQSLFEVTDDSITRMVKRGELPPPITLGTRHVWCEEVIVQFIRERHEAALRDDAREKAQKDAKVATLYGGHHRGRC